MFASVEPQGRTPFAAVVSLVLHAVALSGAVWLGYVHVASPAIDRQPLSYMRAILPELATPIPVRRREAPRVEPRREWKMDTGVVLPAPAELPRADPQPESHPAPSPSLVMPPAPTRVVQTGEFGGTPSAVARVEPRPIQTPGFEVQQVVAPAIKSRAAEVGAFEAREGNVARPGSGLRSERPAASVSSGFGGSEPISTNRAAARAVTSSAFGGAEARPVSTQRKTDLKAAGFADTPAPQTPAPEKSKVDSTVTPVEVLFKPMPAYSDEARSLRIEGEVTLEVDFCATGQVRVVRVVRGLGHGLDDLAARAAEQVRFKPAQSGGRPIDFRASVQIVFRLT